MSEIKAGDRARVTIEGTVTLVGEGSVRINRPNDAAGFAWAKHEDIEKIEPPVEVFKPGDVVRRKGQPDVVFALGSDGYMRLGEGPFNGGFPHYTYSPYDRFTSERYERVDLS